MRDDLIERLAQRHAERTQAGLARRVRTLAEARGPHVVVDRRELLSFASNDYLGLAGHAAVRDAGLNVCCGGIVGMGETTRDRASMLATLANLPQHPESVPINQLVRVPGTPLEGAAPVDPFDFV
ncbi:MAG TPA: hypothetical protein VFL14_16260, partial [Xanthomonadales bacterium]|nr:hypothetical protein [Xanthomonadales bacterium]